MVALARGARPSPSTLVAAAQEAVAALRQGAPGDSASGWPHSERQATITALDALVREITVYRGQVLLAHREDGRWGTTLDRDFADWRARQTGTGRGAVLTELDLAEGLESMPEVAEAVDRGQLNIEHAKTLSRLRSKGSDEVRQALDNGATSDLVDLGKKMSAPELGKEAKKWAAGLDAAAAQKDFEAARRRRSLTMRNHAGGVKGEFFLDAVAGAELRAAIDALDPRPAKDDQRTGEQRRADALSTMAARVLQVGADLNGAQVRPHLSLLVSEQTWARVQQRRQEIENNPGAPVPPLGEIPPAVLEDGTIVPVLELERIMCDCETTRIVMNAFGVPLDVGQTQRTYSKELRRAVTARDKKCQWPGCHRRASYSEVHHITWFSNGGATSIDNAITLCSYHHHRIHEQHIRITVLPDGFDFHHPDGRCLGTTRRTDLQGTNLSPDTSGRSPASRPTPTRPPTPPPAPAPPPTPRSQTPSPQSVPLSRDHPPPTGSPPPQDSSRPRPLDMYPATVAAAPPTLWGTEPPF